MQQRPVLSVVRADEIIFAQVTCQCSGSDIFRSLLGVERTTRYRTFSDGGVIFVSHDERLIELVADELWVVNKGVDGEPGSVMVWHSSYEAYKEKLHNEFAATGLNGSGTVRGVG